ncbi:MAG: FxLYD domain-containing protein [Planctomycetota bacterium]
MSAKVHCSNCGEEIANFSLSWGKNQWLWSLFAFLPILIFYWWIEKSIFFTGEFRNEIQVSLVETRMAENRIDVLGKLQNTGDEHWDRITVEAEFFGPEGQFLDEVSDYMSIGLAPGDEENFRITLANPILELRRGADTEVRLKVTDASTSRF